MNRKYTDVLLAAKWVNQSELSEFLLLLKDSGIITDEKCSSVFIIKESKEDNELLSAVGQMSLCFTEVFVFALLAFIAKFVGENVFYVIFILSIVSTIIINIDIKSENKKHL